MKCFLLFCLVITPLCIFSQEKFSQEISFVTDNDLYVSVNKDRYYTNGMFLQFRYLSKNKKPNLEKRIFEWQIGHKMYTPYKATVSDVSLHDRPFAAYLYGSFGINNVYKNNQILQIGLQIGAIGPNAYGKELQDFIHTIYGFKEAIGWEYEIENAFGANITASYVKYLTKDTSNNYDISWINTAQLGTVYTNVATGFYGRIGFKPLQKLANSIAFNTNINNENTNYTRQIESFIYLKPIVHYAHYDATLQGSFLNKNSVVTKELIPFVFDVELGFLFTANRFNFGYAFKYTTNKSKGLRHTNGNKYGTITISYLMR